MGAFAKQIHAFNIDFSRLSDEVFRATTIKFFGAIIEASPVDTGRFRGNWFATGLQPSVRQDGSSDKTGSKAVQRMTKKVNSLPGISVFHLTNNLPYSGVLEFGQYPDGPKTKNGFSAQAPRGMVRVTAKIFNSLFEQEARKRI